MVRYGAIALLPRRYGYLQAGMAACAIMAQLLAVTPARPLCAAAQRHIHARHCYA